MKILTEPGPHQCFELPCTERSQYSNFVDLRILHNKNRPCENARDNPNPAPQGHSEKNRGAFLLNSPQTKIQMIGYESGNCQISSDFKYVHFDYIFNHFGACTSLILQVVVDLEVLKNNSPPPGVRRLTTQIQPPCQVRAWVLILESRVPN